VTAPDTSVLIAGFDSAHPFHPVAQRALSDVRRRGRTIGHTLAETVSVLTAPGPYGFAAEPVRAYLEPFLEREPLGLAPRDYPRVLEELVGLEISGGAIYDALIAVGAREGRATLVSLDRRAATTYRRCHAEYELLL